MEGLVFGQMDWRMGGWRLDKCIVVWMTDGNIMYKLIANAQILIRRRQELTAVFF